MFLYLMWQIINIEHKIESNQATDVLFDIPGIMVCKILLCLILCVLDATYYDHLSSHDGCNHTYHMICIQI